MNKIANKFFLVRDKFMLVDYLLKKRQNSEI